MRSAVCHSEPFAPLRINSAKNLGMGSRPRPFAAPAAPLRACPERSEGVTAPRTERVIGCTWYYGKPSRGLAHHKGTKTTKGFLNLVYQAVLSARSRERRAARQETGRWGGGCILDGRDGTWIAHAVSLHIAQPTVSRSWFAGR